MDISYRELKNLVPETPKGKMIAKKLEGEEILIKERIDGADVTIYKNGYILYTKYSDDGTPHSTVYSVHRCNRVVFKVSFSLHEREDEWDCSALANEIAYRVIDGNLTKLHIIHEKEYLDLPWWLPVTTICEERIRNNQNSREEYRSEFSLDGNEDDVWTSELAYNSIEDWIEEEEKKENHEKLMAGMKDLTEIQRKTVDLYFSNYGITERQVAKELGVDQSTVHRNLQAALKKLKKFF